MRYPDSKRLKYLAYMTSIVVIILAAFNTVITFQIHKQLVKVVSNPGRWPAGAYVYDQSIGFDFATDISGKIGDGGSFYVKSHHLGYRIAEKEDAASYRPGGILSLGCSFTYGDEVNSEQTFTQLAADGMGIPAYNYGICSFSYTHALLKAQKLKAEGVLDKLQPRYVILGCWSGLPERSVTPFPPMASKSLPLPAAYLVKDGNDLKIQSPMKIRHIFGMVEMYRQEGTGMSFRKFIRIFTAAPRYVHLYLKYNRLAQGMKMKSFKNSVTDAEVYEFYFTGIEDLFSSYNSRIIVLFMPNKYSDEQPGDALLEALARHPAILFADGYQALQRYGVPSREYAIRHPQPAAHRAYSLEVLNAVKQK
jgi:hypothetical protein